MQTNSLDKKTFYPNRLKAVFLLIICLVFVVIGIYMIQDGDRMGWMVALFFGLGVLVFIINLLPQASYLKLDEEGFEMCSLFRKHNYFWKDVHTFGVGVIGGNKMVMFDFSKDFNKAMKSRKIASALSGAEGALHDTFGFKAEELADLMNAYQAKYTFG